MEAVLLSQPEAPVSPGVDSPLRVSFVAGTRPGKWFERWEQRFPGRPVAAREVSAEEQWGPLESGDAQVGLLRLDPEALAELRAAGSRWHAVRLYQENMAVLAAKGHPIGLFEELAEADLEGEVRLAASAAQSWDEVAALVRAEVGIAVLPGPLAWHLSTAGGEGEGTVVRPLRDQAGPVVYAVWARVEDGPVIQDFVGVLRGRKPGSSRNEGEAEPGGGKRAGRAEGNPGRAGRARAGGGQAQAGGKGRGGSRRGGTGRGDRGRRR